MDLHTKMILRRKSVKSQQKKKNTGSRIEERNLELGIFEKAKYVCNLIFKCK